MRDLIPGKKAMHCLPSEVMVITRWKAGCCVSENLAGTFEYEPLPFFVKPSLRAPGKGGSEISLIEMTAKGGGRWRNQGERDTY